MRKIEKFGYNQKVINEGKKLIKDVELIITDQGVGFGLQKIAQAKAMVNAITSLRI
jgi:hypothetical protein